MKLLNTDNRRQVAMVIKEAFNLILTIVFATACATLPVILIDLRNGYNQHMDISPVFKIHTHWYVFLILSFLFFMAFIGLFIQLTILLLKNQDNASESHN